MTIKVRGDRVAAIHFDIPVFVGATGDNNTGMFPDVGWHHPIAAFVPEKGEVGTLVFDRAEPTDRTSFSMTFFHYWWKDDKLVVKEGFDANRFRGRVRLDSVLGLTWNGPSFTYHTTRASDSSWRFKRVGIIDLLRFLEGKMSLQALDDKIIEK